MNYVSSRYPAAEKYDTQPAFGWSQYLYARFARSLVLPMNNERLNSQPSWVSDVYTPEGADRPSHNPPVTRLDEDLSIDKPTSVADVVSEANRNRRLR